MTTRPDHDAPHDRHQAWVAALDALDKDIEAAEALVPRPAAWTPPQGLGPLPADLVARADATVTRQFAAYQAMALAVASNRRQAAAIRRVEVGSQGRPRAAFVDYAA